MTKARTEPPGGPEAARWIIGLAALADRMMNEAVRPLGLSVREWLVLTAIDNSPGATAGYLAGYAYPGRAGIGKLLSEMRDGGLIHVLPPDSENGFGRGIYLTATGSTLIEDGHAARAVDSFFHRLLGKTAIDTVRKGVGEMLADPSMRRTAEAGRRRRRMVRGLHAAGWSSRRIGRVLGMAAETVREHLGITEAGKN